MLKSKMFSPPDWLAPVSVAIDVPCLSFRFVDPVGPGNLLSTQCIGSEGLVCVTCPRTKRWVVLSNLNLTNDKWEIRRLLKNSRLESSKLGLTVSKTQQRNAEPLWHNWATICDDKGHFSKLERPPTKLGNGVERLAAKSKGCHQILSIFDPPKPAGSATTIGTGPHKLAHLTHATLPRVYTDSRGTTFVHWAFRGDAVLAYGFDEFVKIKEAADATAPGLTGIVVDLIEHMERSNSTRVRMWEKTRLALKTALSERAVESTKECTPPGETDAFVLSVMAAIEAEENLAFGARADLATLSLQEYPPCLGLRANHEYSIEVVFQFSGQSSEPRVLRKGQQIYLQRKGDTVYAFTRCLLGKTETTRNYFLTQAVPLGNTTGIIHVRATTGDHKHEQRKLIFTTMDHLKKMGVEAIERDIYDLFTLFFADKTGAEWKQRGAEILTPPRNGKYLSPLCKTACPFVGWECNAAHSLLFPRVATVIEEAAKAKKENELIDAAIMEV